MLNIGRLRPGGADYYVGEVATSAEDYYLGHGEAPGRWVGSLAAQIGMKGQVEPEHFRRILEGRDPLTGEQLVAGHREAPVAAYVSEAVDESLTTAQAAQQLRCSERYVRRLLRTGGLVGEKAVSGDTGHVGWRVRRSEVNRHAADHVKPRSRPGFDVTLRPPKSVAVLWALGTQEQRVAIRQAHREAVDEVVRYLAAAAFDHRTSRAGDPLLHTHVVVANLSRTVEGNWRALDGRPLYDHAISGGHLYQAHLRQLLTTRLGVTWGPMRRGWAEVGGVPQTVIDLFSQRRDEIEELLAEQGYDSARARQTATLATRQAKDYKVTADTLAEQWRTRSAAAGFGPAEVADCFDRVVSNEATAQVEMLLRRLAGPTGITARASTFTRRDVIRWVANDAGGGLPAPVVEHLADSFLASDAAVPLIHDGKRGRAQLVLGSDGRMVRTGGLATFTTPEILDLEARLLRLTSEPASATSTATPAAVTEALSHRAELSIEQRAMVEAVCTSTATMLAIVGRPGSGKTYAAEACMAALRAADVAVLGCAVSATAAAELERAAGVPSTTIAGLLGRLGRGEEALVPGTVLLVDEASMVGTRDLARLAHRVHDADGRVVLVGDPDQHAAVDCGGVFRYLANRSGVLRLVENNRQEDPYERLAIEDYRQGRIADALARYDDSGQVVRCATAGECYDAMVADWYVAWTKGETDRMIAGPNSTRRALNSRARRLLKAEGHLKGPALTVAGRELMVGDLVIARRNDRTLRARGHRAFVKNGSAGRVVSIDVEASEAVIDFAKEGRVRLPATYLADGHLEHGYARTSYLAQGATHGTGRYHPTDTSGFEEGYVALTRARHQTRIYVVEGEATIDDEASHGRSEPRDASLDTVTGAMSRRSTNTTAYEHDPSASRVEDLAQRCTPVELQLRRRRLEHVLAACPPDLSEELAGARRQRDQLASTRRRPWVGRALDKVEAVLTDLETRQADHEQFRADHVDEYETVDVLSRAETSARLRLAISATLKDLDLRGSPSPTCDVEPDLGIETW